MRAAPPHPPRAPGHRRAGALLATIALVAAVVLVASRQPVAAQVPFGALGDPASYPRDSWRDLKGLQPDFWPALDDVTPQLGTVSINFMWAEWEPVFAPPPCAPEQLEVDGHCFTVPSAVDQQVRQYSAAGVPATAIVYGTPAWARGARPCTPITPGFEIFCVPDHPADFARFAGLVAARYDGAHGNGRVTDFVIQNEVNTNDWFDIGCGQGVPCDVTDWVHTYADLYDAAYDRIVVAQPQARVLVSLTHHYLPVLDRPAVTHPVLSVQTFLALLDPLLGGRQWSVAIHPYTNNGLQPRFDADDLPGVTLGNIGVLPGWLRARFPDQPRAWEVQITEVGLNNPGQYDDLQAQSLCAAYRNVAGTPGITSFIYHRLLDNAAEMGLSLGLRRTDGSAKPAFGVWHDMTDPTHPSCGFELDDHTRVRHFRDPDSGANWYTSRQAPVGYDPMPDAWLLDRREAAGTAMVYECGDGEHFAFLTRDASCPGRVPMGPVGAIRTDPAPGFTALFACGTGASQNVGVDPACAAGPPEVLGYVPGAATTVAGTEPVPDATAPAMVVTATPSFTG